MKFSFFMMPLHHPSENPTLAFDRDIALIHYADALDFDEFFIGEHHSGGWETMPAPEMVLAKAAAHAHRIRLGTSVLSLPFHHPFHVAERRFSRSLDARPRHPRRRTLQPDHRQKTFRHHR